MVAIGALILGRNKNPAFLDNIKIANYKRDYLASIIIKNPELYFI